MRIVGTGTRVLNFLVDIIIISAIGFGIQRGINFYARYYGTFYLPIYYTLPLTGFVYYLFFESLWKRTPGKWLSLSKVVTKNGGKPSFLQILIRSVARVLGVIIIDSMFLSFINKTMHDYISKTEVVEI